MARDVVIDKAHIHALFRYSAAITTSMFRPHKDHNIMPLAEIRLRFRDMIKHYLKVRKGNTVSNSPDLVFFLSGRGLSIKVLEVGNVE